MYVQFGCVQKNKCLGVHRHTSVGMYRHISVAVYGKADIHMLECVQT